MPNPEQKTDHKAEALRLLEEADDERCKLEGAEVHRIIQLQCEATVHSNLAIAEGQERLALLREEESLVRIVKASFHRLRREYLQARLLDVRSKLWPDIPVAEGEEDR